MSEDLVENWREYKLRNKKIVQAIACKRWRESNPDKLQAIKVRRKTSNIRNIPKEKAWRKANPDSVIAARLRCLYGPGSEVHKANMTKVQNNLCAICGKFMVKTPNLDHNHSTGQWRGVLCGGCNFKVGVIESNLYPKVLDYLVKWEAEACQTS